MFIKLGFLIACKAKNEWINKLLQSKMSHKAVCLMAFIVLENLSGIFKNMFVL